MSDPAFVVAAYAIVLGGLALYVASLFRRVRAARRTAEALDRERKRGRFGAAPEPASLTTVPSETSR